MKKADKLIFYSIFYVPVFLVFSYFLWSIIFNETSSQVIERQDLDEVLNGKVDSLYFDKQNHNVKIALLSDGYQYQIFRRWEILINIGDSLVKQKGTFLLEIHKKNGRLIKLDYRDNYKKK